MLAINSSRLVARNCLNENDLLQIAERYGFVAFDPAERGFVEQVGAFRGAEAIVGAHGSAWANCVFMQPDSLSARQVPSGTSSSGRSIPRAGWGCPISPICVAARNDARPDAHSR